MQDSTWVKPSIILALLTFLIHINEAWRGKELDNNIITLAKGIPNGKIETIP